jgi:hypothetical protein
MPSEVPAERVPEAGIETFSSTVSAFCDEGQEIIALFLGQDPS